MSSKIKFITFPQTLPPPPFIDSCIEAFRSCESDILSVGDKNQLESNEVLEKLEPFLRASGWEVESGKNKSSLLERPIFYGENGKPTRTLHVDGYLPEFKCGLEVESGRGMQGNAVYRDLIFAMLMTGVDHLIIAVRQEYWSGKKARTMSPDYKRTVAICEPLYAHARIKMPYGLTIIGY